VTLYLGAEQTISKQVVCFSFLRDTALKSPDWLPERHSNSLTPARRGAMLGTESRRPETNGLT